MSELAPIDEPSERQNALTTEDTDDDEPTGPVAMIDTHNCATRPRHDEKRWCVFPEFADSPSCTLVDVLGQHSIADCANIARGGSSRELAVRMYDTRDAAESDALNLIALARARARAAAEPQEVPF